MARSKDGKLWSKDVLEALRNQWDCLYRKKQFCLVHDSEMLCVHFSISPYLSLQLCDVSFWHFWHLSLAISFLLFLFTSLHVPPAGEAYDLHDCSTTSSSSTYLDKKAEQGYVPELPAYSLFRSFIYFIIQVFFVHITAAK